MKNIYIGYEPNETIAYHVCTNSIIRHSKSPLAIIPLALSLMSLYNESHTDGSNSFTYTRFLVPYLQSYNGWALFIDGDMVLLDDITQLWDNIDETKAAFVVQHNYKTKMSIKYLGSKNENYHRKNWSSVILWNCAHLKNRVLTPEFIQESSGAFLHQFSWLLDDEIGNLPIEWNWLPDEFGINQNAKLLHYTLGTPCFESFKDTPMADKWNEEFTHTTYCLQDKE
jgi:lipopolysaccharide biosynthesis glycosyltransferase